MDSAAPPRRHSAQLFDFLAAFAHAPAPATVQAQARRCLLDSIGCALFGARQEWGRLMADQVIAESARGKSTLFGRADTVKAAAAALANGTSTHGFELDDLIAEGLVHPGAVVVPAAFAVAEATGASGERLLTAIAAGYETMLRISLAMTSSPWQRGFHCTGVVGPVGAAVAAGVVMGFNAQQIAGAVGLACSCGAGLKTFANGSGGGMVKRLHAGQASASGVRAAELAARGFTGPSAALDGRFGLIEAFAGGDARLEELTKDLGKTWAIDSVWTKMYPICGWIHGVAELIEQLRGPAPLAADAVKRVRVGTARHAVHANNEVAPADTMGAQYSIPYCAALAVTGDAADPATYAQSAVDRPGWRELARRVELYVEQKAEDVYPAQFASYVTLELASGEQRVAETMDPHGTPGSPCSDAEREQKFRRLASASLTPGAIDDVYRTIEAIATAPSVEALSAALRAPRNVV